MILKVITYCNNETWEIGIRPLPVDQEKLVPGISVKATSFLQPFFPE